MATLILNYYNDCSWAFPTLVRLIRDMSLIKDRVCTLSLISNINIMVGAIHLMVCSIRMALLIIYLINKRMSGTHLPDRLNNSLSYELVLI